jgi:predicted pyridoxine 5'-phosphate oxidase superfamily flavin-nucleotide-binding protein
MAKVFEQIDDRLKAFIEAQPVFFVGTAPNGPGGHVNVSPKGGKGLFRVTGPLGFAYVDLMGSGIETIAHLRENGRITIMFASFEGPPKIVRLHGTGRVSQQGDDGFTELVATFDASDEQLPAVRSVIAVDVERVSDSCGFVVPRMAYEGERDQLYRWTDNRLRKEGPDAMRAYAASHNAESIDGLAGLDPLVPR